MTDDIFDDRIKELISKADKITHDELVQRDLEEKISILKEKYGRLRISITKQQEKIDKVIHEYKEGQKLQEKYKHYFKLITTYSGKELEERLENDIPDYSPTKYLGIQDEVYALTGNRNQEEFDRYVRDLRVKSQDLENRKSHVEDELEVLIKKYEELFD